MSSLVDFVTIFPEEILKCFKVFLIFRSLSVLENICGLAFDETCIDIRQLKIICAMPSLINTAEVPLGKKFYLNKVNVLLLFQYFILYEKGHRL